MKFIFIGEPGDTSDRITAFGYKFSDGKPVDIPEEDAHAIRKLSANTHFKAVAEEAKAEEPPRRGRPPKAIQSDND